MRGHVLLAVGLCACGATRRGPGDQVDAQVTSDTQGNGGGDGSTGEQVYVYAHTASTLYRVDPDTLAVSMVGNFGWPSGSDQMTDLAIDQTGLMIGVSFSSVYRVDPNTAQATLLSSSLGGTFNGLSFVPAAMLGQTGADVLVGTRNSDGKVFRVDPATGATTQVGDMGAFSSSGDLVSIASFGTVQTVPGSSSDVLTKLAPSTFAATAVGSGTGFSEIWGIAYWKDKVYGFTNGGDFVLIDPNTGAATLVSHQDGLAWWGAAVTTLAPVIQ
jgi:hypothetical protein